MGAISSLISQYQIGFFIIIISVSSQVSCFICSSLSSTLVFASCIGWHLVWFFFMNEEGVDCLWVSSAARHMCFLLSLLPAWLTTGLCVDEAPTAGRTIRQPGDRLLPTPLLGQLPNREGFSFLRADNYSTETSSLSWFKALSLFQ